MDSEALLDYALFQLTPTRTRCDLVVFSGRKSEKIASGLVEPFICHLKFAKDQIPKGGYSITLRPPTTGASWFTKATFQRLVRFINFPEILERFVRIEREILQIENSVQSSELPFTNIETHAEEGSLSFADGITKKSTDSSKFKRETGEAGDVGQENSKIQLQRLLETRKALLRKEQAMAYARALVAGFEMDNMDDLILFADNFGASRLREACIDFKELCKKKHTDGLWMDELAAMAACSPSELAYSGTSGVLNFHSNIVTTVDASSDLSATQANLEGNKDNTLPPSDQLPSTPAKAPVQMPWPNQIPQYMYNFQGPVQQIPRGQVYPYHGMQPISPYYPGHLSWPPNINESSHGPVRGHDHRRHHKSSSRRKERSRTPGTSEEEEQIESSDSDSLSDSNIVTKHEKYSSSSKKHSTKKSSKTVVIRNINYITSKRKNGVSDDSSSLVENELVDEDSLKKKVDDVIESLETHHKSSKNSKKKGMIGFPDHDLDSGKQNENWDAFQNLLVIDEDSPKTMDVQDEHFTIKNSDDGHSVAVNHAIDLEYENVATQPKTTKDSFVICEREGANEGRVNSVDFANGENFRPSMKGRDSADAQLLVSQRPEETGDNVQNTLSYFQPESSIIRSGKEDWFVVDNSHRTIEKTTFDDDFVLSMKGDHFYSKTSKDLVPIDESFMVQARSLPHSDLQWRTEISMAEDLNETGVSEVSDVKVGECGAYEPDDLCVVVSRDSGLESGRASWTPEMDYGNGISFTKAEQKSAPVEMNDQTEEKLSLNSKSKKAASPTTNNLGKERSKISPGSLPSSRADMLSKNKKVLSSSRPFVQKTKLQKEEEARKKMEELAIQRQKRIAERTAASASAPAASKIVPIRSKTGTTNSAKGQVVPGQIKHKGGSDQLKITSSKVIRS